MRRRMASRCGAPRPGSWCSQWSPRSASITSLTGSVPYSIAMPVYSACGHSQSTTFQIMPCSGAELDEPSWIDVTSGPHQTRARASAAASSR